MGRTGSSMAFSCYRLGLIFFNIIYMIIGFTLILSPVYSKFAKIFTSWPIVGGTIACGVFIMLIAAAGIYGAVKHHQIILFFFMAVMVIIFIILFSVSVAALSITSTQQHTLLKKAWGSISNTTKQDIQKLGDCCGFENMNITSDHPSCSKLSCCGNVTAYSCHSCHTCYKYLMKYGLDKLKNAVGGIGLFFSLTMFVGIYLAFRYRHLKDPRANPSAFL
ncbi:Tetraspanin-13 [Desmophyllum pertusum]|uniref:Tetraspanin-13 n=1 Tax=Desmophyllum pertusum TaxID=174260 RepID=A0A9W9ZML0_9CNID|nr:Tetraspanin-13 [Desmophyllum pertusum]